MKRTPEPDLMNQAEQAYAYANADFTEPHNTFVSIFKNKLILNPKHEKVLDLGCGPCDITIRMAKQFPNFSFTAIDGATEMLKLGELSIEKNKLKNKIQLINAYIPIEKIKLSSQLNHNFDIIISNSLLHHLKNPMDLWMSIRNYASPNANILIMDLLRPKNKSEAERLVDQYSEHEPEILKKDFYNSLLAAYSVAEVQQQLVTQSLNLNIEIISDRHFIVYGKITD